MTMPGFTAEQALTPSRFIYSAGARRVGHWWRLRPMQETSNYDTTGGEGQGDPGADPPPDTTGDEPPTDGTTNDNSPTAYDAFTRNYDTLTCVDDCTNGINDPACNDCEAMIDSRQCTDALQCQDTAPHVTVCTCHVPPLVA
jgi:hypothetical protein